MLRKMNWRWILLFKSVCQTGSFQVGISVIPGIDSDRPSKVYQDSYIAEEITTTDRERHVLVGVLDGHGKDGRIVSEFCAKRLPLLIKTPQGPPPFEFLEKLYTLGKATRSKYVHPKHQILIDAFHQVHYEAMQDRECPAGRSGTTCALCWIEPDEVHVAYVGDSRAILIDGNNVTAWATETTVHQLPEEKERIDSCEGRIDGNGNVWYGPVAIAMTRSLGDAAMLRAGILPTPITATFPRKEGTVLVLATDGVWDQLANDRVVEIVQSNMPNTSLAAEDISTCARRKWIGDFIDEKADDITCLVLKL